MSAGAAAIAQVIAEVGLPAVYTGDWPAALKANRDTIRAALYSGEALQALSRSGGAQVALARDDRRVLVASREKKGWIVQVGPGDRRVDFFAARPGSKHIGTRVKMTRVRSFLFLFNGYDHFSWQEVEEMMLQFISTAGNPPSAHWVGVDWT